MTEAGFANGFETMCRTSVDGTGQLIPVAMAEWIQRDLAKVGIKMKLRTFDWITYIGYWIKGMDDPSNKVGSQQMSWGMTSDYWLDIVTHSSHVAPAGGAGQNGGYYSGADTLLDRRASRWTRPSAPRSTGRATRRSRRTRRPFPSSTIWRR